MGRGDRPRISLCGIDRHILCFHNISFHLGHHDDGCTEIWRWWKG